MNWLPGDVLLCVNASGIAPSMPSLRAGGVYTLAEFALAGSFPPRLPNWLPAPVDMVRLEELLFEPFLEAVGNGDVFAAWGFSARRFVKLYTPNDGQLVAELNTELEAA